MDLMLSLKLEMSSKILKYSEKEKLRRSMNKLKNHGSAEIF
jgi:hypothetical protein